MSNSWSIIKDFKNIWEDDNEQEEWNNIINKFILILDKHLSSWWCDSNRIEKVEKRFCCFMGLQYTKLEPEEDYDLYEEMNYGFFSFESTHLYHQLQSVQDQKYLAKVIQNMFLVLEEEMSLDTEMRSFLGLEIDYKTKNEIDTFTSLYEEIKAVGQAHQSFSTVRQKKSITIYPYGSPLLDEEVIHKTLEGLEDHPYISEKFQYILKKYESAEKNYCSHEYGSIIQGLHLVIEQLLKEILGNNSSFEKQIEKRGELGKYLKEKNISEHIRNILIKILPCYKDYSNEQGKHEHPSGNSCTKPEVEFIIYLTGTLIRFLTQISEGE